MSQDADGTPTTPDDASQDIANLRKRLGANMERLKNEHGLSWGAIEDKAGVSRMQLYNVRVGKKAATIDLLAKVARVFNAEPHTLLE